MYFNIHVFTAITTVVFYFLLKSFKKCNQKQSKKQSNLIYLLFAPLIVYLTFFLYNKSNNFSNYIVNDNTNVSILSRPNLQTPNLPISSNSSIYPIQSTLSDMS